MPARQLSSCGTHALRERTISPLTMFGVYFLGSLRVSSVTLRPTGRVRRPPLEVDTQSSPLSTFPHSLSTGICLAERAVRWPVMVTASCRQPQSKAGGLRAPDFRGYVIRHIKNYVFLVRYGLGAEPHHMYAAAFFPTTMDPAAPSVRGARARTFQS